MYDLTTVTKKYLSKTLGLSDVKVKSIMKYRHLFQMLCSPNNEVEGISARLLYTELGYTNSKDFNRWFIGTPKRGGQVQKCGLIVNEDYVEFITGSQSGDRLENGQFAQIDYVISLDAAKAICLGHNSDAGRAFRHYFIAAEKVTWELNIYNPPRMAAKDNHSELYQTITKRCGYNKHETSKMLAQVCGLISLHSTGAYPSQWKQLAKNKAMGPQKLLSGKDEEHYLKVQEQVLDLLKEEYTMNEIRDGLNMFYPTHKATSFQKFKDSH